MAEQYMRRALELAYQGEGRTTPNPMVGAVVVKDGVICGEGYHRKAGGPHAEVFALQAAGDKAKDATLYVTLEPCNHFGRTPPCTETVINAGIARVVVAAVDPNPLVAGRGLKRLAEAGIQVTSGILEQEAVQMNEVFNKYITSRKPFVVWKTAMTLDGKIATGTGDSRWVTGEAAREQVHRLRDKYDAIMVGIGTIVADDPLLTTRLTSGKGKDPVRVVVDSRLRLPKNARVINRQSEARTLVATTGIFGNEQRQKAATLAGLGVEVIKVGTRDERVDLENLLDLLAKREITSVLLEGGAELAASFLELDLVDKVHFYIAPKLVGGRDAPGPLGGRGIAKMAGARTLKQWKMDYVGEDLLLTGYL